MPSTCRTARLSMGGSRFQCVFLFRFHGLYVADFLLDADVWTKKSPKPKYQNNHLLEILPLRSPQNLLWHHSRCQPFPRPILLSTVRWLGWHSTEGQTELPEDASESLARFRHQPLKDITKSTHTFQEEHERCEGLFTNTPHSPRRPNEHRTIHPMIHKVAFG